MKNYSEPESIWQMITRVTYPNKQAAAILAQLSCLVSFPKGITILSDLCLDDPAQKWLQRRRRTGVHIISQLEDGSLSSDELVRLYELCGSNVIDCGAILFSWLEGRVDTESLRAAIAADQDMQKLVVATPETAARMLEIELLHDLEHPIGYADIGGLVESLFGTASDN